MLIVVVHVTLFISMKETFYLVDYNNFVTILVMYVQQCLHFSGSFLARIAKCNHVTAEILLTNYDLIIVSSD